MLGLLHRVRKGFRIGPCRVIASAGARYTYVKIGPAEYEPHAGYPRGLEKMLELG